MKRKVQVGDYIEGYEFIGTGIFFKIHKTRIIVNNIINRPDGLIYEGKADDSYGGARGTCIRSELGKVRIIEDEEPFTEKWWENQQMVFYTWERDWSPEDIVRKFDGSYYKIVDFGINSETLEQFVVYKNLEGTKIFVEPREVFEQLNNRENREQTFKFEKINKPIYQMA